MNAEEFVSVAQRVADVAHAGQLDKSGQPYILHPQRVARRLPHADHYGRIVAWLHDVIEDTHVTLGDLVDWGFDGRVIDAVHAITKVDNETNDAYIARVAVNPIARRVKLADLADNMDPVRMARLDDATVARLMKKYTRAVAQLSQSGSV